MTTLSEHAPAKINLTLHVLGRRLDGYHELDSLVVFAPCGDTVTLTPGPVMDVIMTGPFASAITDDNLIMKAARLARETAPDLRIGSFTLDKHLPVAAGLGGGSSDAAAALRLIRRANPAYADGIDWQGIAARCGADVPVCLLGRAARMQGLGERVTPVGPLPPIGCVLVNPRVPLPTAAVFRALAAPTTSTAVAGPAWPDDLSAGPALMDLVASGRNDLEQPARRLCPPVSEILESLSAIPGVRLARMSGSGPTCFALVETPELAREIAATLAGRRPDWWIASSSLQ